MLKNNYQLKILIFAFVLFVNTTSFAQQKNILFIMADDWNHWTNSIGYYPQSITPNVDALGKKGVLFTDVHNSSPVCNPSRNALWSGLRPTTTGITTNESGYFRDKSGLENAISLNQYFKMNGYHVYGAGKIYHPGRMGSHDTDPGNWSELNTDQSGSHGGNYYFWKSPSLYERGLFEWGAGIFDIEENGFDTRLSRSVESFIDNYDKTNYTDKPFFIACGLFRPHLPWKCHKDFWDLFNPDSLQIPKGYMEGDLDDVQDQSTMTIFNEIKDAGVWKEAIRAYLANMAYADYNVGIMMNALENSPYKDNTIVVFCGDHGWHLGEKNRWSKYSLWDVANRTTLVIYDPSAGGNGTVCQRVVSLQDIYPTLVELAGLPTKKHIEGVSLKPLLDDPERNDWNSMALMSLGINNMLKTDKYRFAENFSQSMLYDIENDPYEFSNLYGKPEYDQVVATMRHQIDSIIAIGTSIRETLSNPGVAPGAPFDLSNSLVGSTSVNLTWRDTSFVEQGFIIEMSVLGSAFDSIGTVTANFQGYSYSGLAHDTEYAFRVKAFNNIGYSAYSNTTTVITGSDGIKSDTIVFYYLENRFAGGKYFEATDGNASFNLSFVKTDLTLWKKVYVDEQFFLLENKAFPGKYLRSANGSTEFVLSEGLSFDMQWKESQSDLGWFFLHNRTHADKSIKTINSANSFDLTADTGWRVQWQFTPGYIMVGEEILAAPQQTSATNINQNSATLSWLYPTSSQFDFVIERSTDRINWYIAGETNATIFTDEGLNPSTTYFYRIKTVRGDLNSYYDFLSLTTSIGTSLKINKKRSLISNYVNNGSLHIDLTYTDIFVSVEIVDINGKILLNRHLIGEQKAVIEIGDYLTTGVYFARINNGYNYSIEKFIVK